MATKNDESAPHETDTNSISEETWDFDLAFKPPPRPPPRFVPASLLPDDVPEHSVASSSGLVDPPTSDVSSWYRSLTSNRSNNQSNAQPQPPPISNDKQTSRPQSPEKEDKNNWFILNAIRSNPESQPTGNTSSTTTLADIIARDPPPLPNEQKFKPPVWLEIGPSNKGFAMLQRSGWSEGEPLGPDVVRQPAIASGSDMIELGTKEGRLKKETIEVKLAGYDDVAELRPVDVIDLTTSDSEDDKYAPASPEREREDHPINPSNDTHGRTALLVPIATVLKSDRLGIGLKAKTVGPYKASQKRVTHNSAALAAHIRAAEEIRRKKKKYGRGKRGFDTQSKKEEANRKHLLAYMND
ncbi:hypothetical protein H0H92_015354 [Tricholoma furcatifolium]|nr:hypothetical protein H0H92_015354 [Tricholoma furcatifolium]